MAQQYSFTFSLYKSQQTVLIQVKFNQVHTFPHISLRSILLLTPTHMFVVKVVSSLRPSHQTFICISHLKHVLTMSTHFFILDLIILLMTGEKYKS
jgi:hypothetical protein